MSEEIINSISKCFTMNVDLEGLKKLEEYITNLQQKVEQLEKENKRLKEWKEDLLSENIELENIRKEAIDWINENKHLSMFADCREPEEDWNYDLECNANDLLNILNKGSDKE